MSSVRDDEVVAEWMEAQASMAAASATTSGAVPTEELETYAREVPANWVLFSEAFGWKPSTIPDIPVPMFEEDTWHEDVRPYIPEDIRAWYIPNNKFIEEIALGVYCNDLTLVWGPSGTGKTEGIRFVCSILRIPFLRVNCTDRQKFADLVGKTVVKTSKDGTSITVFDNSLGSIGFKHGGWLCLDEAFRSPVLMALQSGFEPERTLVISDAPGLDISERKLKAPVDRFWITLTDNTCGLGDETGTFTAEVQDASVLDRVTATSYKDYDSPSVELRILKKKWGKFIGVKMLKDMHTVCTLIRTAHKKQTMMSSMSIRGLSVWAQKFAIMGDVGKALKIAVFNKLVEDDQRQVSEIYQQVFGRSI